MNAQQKKIKIEPGSSLKNFAPKLNLNHNMYFNLRSCNFKTNSKSMYKLLHFTIGLIFASFYKVLNCWFLVKGLEISSQDL